jgi:hypothetical protein
MIYQNNLKRFSRFCEECDSQPSNLFDEFNRLFIKPTSRINLGTGVETYSIGIGTLPEKILFLFNLGLLFTFCFWVTWLVVILFKRKKIKPALKNFTIFLVLYIIYKFVILYLKS